MKKRIIKMDNNPRGSRIELIAEGNQFVACGTHQSGVRYQWLPSLPEQIPTITAAQVEAIWTRLMTYATPESQKVNQIAQDGAATTMPTEHQVLTTISDSEWLQLLDALRFLLDTVSSNDDWSKIGYALLSIQHTRPARQLWVDFSKKAAGYEEGAPESWWDTHVRSETRTDYRHIFTLARKRGWGAMSRPEDFAPVDDKKIPDSGAGPAGGPDGPDAADPGLNVIPDAPTKPIVQLIDRNFSAIIDRLEEVFKPEVYTQGVYLTRLMPGHEDDEIQRSVEQLMLVPVTKAYARKRAGEIATFMKFAPVKGTWYETSPSAEHVNAMIEQGAWRRLRPLDAIARAPFIRRDGSICDRAGYDRVSRVLFVPSAEYPAIPRDPGHADALSALERVREVFHQFPWTADVFESGFLAHVLSEVGRLAFNRSPMFFYNAPSSGTGKTLLQKAASIIAHGSIPALRPWVSNADEIRKTIYASLLAGDRSLLFDNVPDGFKIRSSELCAAITAESWQDRKLGASEVHVVPNRAVFSASGNNVNPAGDLARRSIIIRLDANTEHLEQRRFDIEDIEEYLIRNRPALLVDVLTVIRAYHDQPDQALTMPVKLPSFEQWSHFVREPLIWLGQPDPVETQKREADDDKKNLGATFEMLRARFGGGEFSALLIAHTAGGLADQAGQLTQAMMGAGCAEPNSPSKVGYWLRSARDKVFNGYKLVTVGHTSVGVQWKFIPVKDDGVAA